MEIKAGKTYRVGNQGKSITPLEIDVFVIWIDNYDVYYSLNRETTVYQTPIERFEEILRKSMK